MLQNPVLSHQLEGDSKKAWEVFERLPDPTPEDERYGGMALLNLGQLNRAKELLLRARGRGCVAAGIDLASTYRELGELNLASQTLKGVDPDALDAYDKVLYYREQGSQEFDLGNLKNATESLECSWSYTFQSPQAEALRSGVAQVLGAAYSTRGLDQQAAEYFTYALESGNPARRVYALISRGRSCVYLGRYKQAETDLETARAGIDRAPLMLSMLHYDTGLLKRALGRLRDAVRSFQECAEEARKAGQLEMAAYADLALCTVYTALEEFGPARAHLAKARPKVSSERAKAILTLREGALLSRLGEAGAREKLEDAAQTFERLTLYREASWAWLHLADLEHRTCAQQRTGAEHRSGAEHRTGEPGLRDHYINKAVDARHSMGNGAMLVFELRELPALLDHLSTLPEDAYARVIYNDYLEVGKAPPRQLRLVTLGETKLLADGRHVRFDMSRSLEVLAYLLRNPGTPLEGIIHDLFPDQDPKLAKNYFHQVRYDLERAVPGLSVPFDQKSKTYSVRLDGPSLRWDVEELKYALNTSDWESVLRAFDLYTGPFLATAETTWAEMEREDMAWSVLKVGLQTLEGLYVQGRYSDCLSLAGRLLEIDPYNEVLGQYLVQATRQLEGELVARLSIERLSQRFEDELGEIPDYLEELRQEVRRIN